MATTYSGTTPKHLWIAGILSLLWNGYGAYDYLMTELDPASGGRWQARSCCFSARAMP